LVGKWGGSPYAVAETRETGFMPLRKPCLADVSSDKSKKRNISPVIGHQSPDHEIMTAELCIVCFAGIPAYQLNRVGLDPAQVR
jgi:hypothetical protein